MSGGRDVLVIGAGASGLAAGGALRRHGVDVVVAEMGQNVMERGSQGGFGAACGVGGAGLYSDGKFSFFPSATRLWDLAPKKRLEAAYRWTATTLQRQGMDPPEYFGDSAPVAAPGLGETLRKGYRSDYMSFQSRVQLVEALAKNLGASLSVGTRAEMLGIDPLEVRLTQVDGRSRLVAPRAVLLASGRFGPWGMPGALESEFRRVEVGVRIEQPAETFLFGDGTDVDPKWIHRSSDGRFEWRTFCCCRDGHVVVTEFDGIKTTSGRADCPPTGRSNIGLNVRLLDKGDAVEVLHRLRFGTRSEPFRVDAISAVADPGSSPLGDYLGTVAAEALAAGIAELFADQGATLDGADLHGPALEGVGYYPDVDSNLRVDAAPVWASGDATGVFRGLTAALVSGRFAADSITVALEQGL